VIIVEYLSTLDELVCFWKKFVFFDQGRFSKINLKFKASKFLKLLSCRYLWKVVRKEFSLEFSELTLVYQIVETISKW
jgi:hypothetical protein